MTDQAAPYKPQWSVTGGPQPQLKTKFGDWPDRALTAMKFLPELANIALLGRVCSTQVKMRKPFRIFKIYTVTTVNIYGKWQPCSSAVWYLSSEASGSLIRGSVGNRKAATGLRVTCLRNWTGKGLQNVTIHFCVWWNWQQWTSKKPKSRCGDNIKMDQNTYSLRNYCHSFPSNNPPQSPVNKFVYDEQTEWNCGL